VLLKAVGEMVRMRLPEHVRLLTSAETAALFQVDRPTVVEWAKAGRLAAIRTPGGRLRFAEPSVQALLDRMRQGRP
jgi:excisionase family DNA binding protein